MDKAAIMEALQDAQAALEALAEELKLSVEGAGDPPPMKPQQARDFLAANAVWEQKYMSMGPCIADGWAYCVDWTEGIYAYPVSLDCKTGDDAFFDNTRGLGFWGVGESEDLTIEWQPKKRDA